MSNFLRRLPLSRLLLLCGVLVGVGIGATALADALGLGPTPPPKPLADAVHGALSAQAPEGVSARITLTDHLLEGASLAGVGGGGDGAGGGLASSPLVTGGSGRLWISKDGRARVELQSEGGDTEIIYDGHTLTLYEPSSNTLYRYTPTQQDSSSAPSASSGSASAGSGSAGQAADQAGSAQMTWDSTPGGHHEVPSVAKIEEAISHVSEHANLSGAIPSDVAGQPAYTVRISPSHNGGLVGGAELSFDAVHGVPLRAALYATGNPAPVIELAATEVSYGAVPDSVFALSPPPGAKVQEVSTPAKEGGASSGGSGATGGGGGASSSSGSAGSGEHPKLTTHGTGLESIVEVESPVKEGSADKSSTALPEGLQKVQINGAVATELPTALGTLLSFERSGVRYLLAGSVTPAAIEAFARGL